MLTRKNLYTIWLLGAISGFTLMISGNTLNFWLASEQIDIRTIGIFSLISIPYALNFLWAPIFDLKKLPIFDKILNLRLSWVCFIQILLSFSIISLGLVNPTTSIMLFSFLSLIVSILSAAQDTVLGALRTEIIPKEAQGEASGIYIFGYRIGMLGSGSGAIFLSEYLNWYLIYLLFGVIILLCPITLILLTYFRGKVKAVKQSKNLEGTFQNKQNPVTIRNFLQLVLKPLGTIKFVFLIITFLVLYRLPDNFINVMINPYLIHLGYSAKQIATTGKFFGVITAIIGGLIASKIMKRNDILNSLLIFGILHAVAHSTFIIQEIYGKNIYLLLCVISFESITGGMTMAAYIAFIASLCQGQFRATQYSFLTAMMGLSRSIFPVLSGYIVMDFGWFNFFAFTVIATFPSLWLILKIRGKFPSKAIHL